MAEKKSVIEGPLYDPMVLWQSLKFRSEKRDIKRVIRLFLDAGAEPIYLEVALAFLSRLYPHARGLRLAREVVAKEAGPSTSSILTALKSGSAEMPIPQQVTEGEVITILFAQGLSYTLDEKPAEKEDVVRYLERIEESSGLREFRISSLPTILYAIRRLVSKTGADQQGLVDKLLKAILPAFLRSADGIDRDELVTATLGVYSPSDPRAWYLILPALQAMLEHMGDGNSSLRIVSRLLSDAFTEGGYERERAWTLLQGGTRYDHHGRPQSGKVESLSVAEFGGLSTLAVGLFEGLSDLRTRHRYIKWLRVAPSPEIQDLLTVFFLKPDLRDPGIKNLEKSLSELEEIVEQFFGSRYWRLFCSLWDKLASLAKDSPEYQELLEAARISHPERHNPDVAEPLEQTVDDLGCKAEALREQIEHLLNLLSGDVVKVKTTTHLQKSWMPVRRKTEEFFGAEAKVVEVCQHPTVQERGAACQFRFRLEGMPEAVRGELDLEGNVTFENVLVLNEVSRAAVQLTVLETLSAVLIPHYVPGSPPRGNGGVSTASLELYARRPVVHEEGVVGRPDLPPIGPPGKVRIHPTVARLLCEWMLGERDDIDFDLFEQEGGSRHRYRKDAAARLDLLNHKRSMSDVYVRPIRAFTSPAGAKLVNGEVVPRKPSDWSRENYERYLQDGGRPLDFSPVTKTYIVDGTGRRVVLEVPRTFNQGTFVTISDALTRVEDPRLVARMLARFR